MHTVASRFPHGQVPLPHREAEEGPKPLQPTGLALNLTTMAEQLRGLGYATHMVGKWHLGESESHVPDNGQSPGLSCMHLEK